MLTSLYEQQQLGNSSEVALGRQWAWASTEANRCQERAAVNGSLLSTAFVARDLMQVAEALEDDGLLRYWGELQLSQLRVEIFEDTSWWLIMNDDN